VVHCGAHHAEIRRAATEVAPRPPAVQDTVAQLPLRGDPAPRAARSANGCATAASGSVRASGAEGGGSNAAVDQRARPGERKSDFLVPRRAAHCWIKRALCPTFGSSRLLQN
jgi:hypothetical protein